MTDRPAGVRERLALVVSQVLGVPAGQVGEESSPNTIEAWDSLAHMDLVLALEEEFGVHFNDEMVLEMLSVGAILAVLRGLLGSSEGDA